MENCKVLVSRRTSGEDENVGRLLISFKSTNQLGFSHILISGDFNLTGPTECMEHIFYDLIQDIASPDE